MTKKLNLMRRLPMKYQAIIFDLDGVICHTDHYHYLAWKKIADELGIPFDESRNNELRGIGRMESLDILLKDYDQKMSSEEKQKYADMKNNIYRNYLSHMTPESLEQGVVEALHVIKDTGVKVAIGSSSKNAKFILEKIGLEKFFDAVVDGNMIVHTKPAPEVFSNAAKLLGIPAKDCLVVEDAKSGLEAAYNAGMDCAAIGDATQYNNSTYKIYHIRDLLEII